MSSAADVGPPEAAPEPPRSPHAPDTTGRNTGELVMALARRVRRAYAEALSEWHVTPSQSRALRVLSGSPGGMRPSVLAEELRIAPRSATEVADALVGRGWVARDPDPTDRRATTLTLTDAGRELVDRIDGVRRRASEEVLDVLLLAGVVHEDVEPAEPVDGVLHELLAEGLVLDVAGQGHGLLARGLDEGDDLLRVLLLLGQVADGHVGSLARVGDGDGRADARVASGDERLATLEAAAAAVGVLAACASSRASPIQAAARHARSEVAKRPGVPRRTTARLTPKVDSQVQPRLRVDCVALIIVLNRPGLLSVCVGSGEG